MWKKTKIVRFLRFLHQFLGKLELLKKKVVNYGLFSPFYYMRLIGRVIYVLRSPSSIFVFSLSPFFVLYMFQTGGRRKRQSEYKIYTHTNQ
jgi:hypothetical protein